MKLLSEMRLESGESRVEKISTSRWLVKMAARLSFLILLSTIYSLLSNPACAQRHDYMTDEEVEIIRNAQDIDTRIDVLTKMIDRRFAVLGIDVGGWKGPSKDTGEWGPPPKGERIELFSDIKRLLQKAIDDIDNLNEFPNSATVRDMKDRDDARRAKEDPHRFSKAVNALAKAAGRYKPPLVAALDATKVEKDKGPILDAIDSCSEIIIAVERLPGSGH